MKRRLLILLAVFLLLLGLIVLMQKREPKEKILRVMPVDSTKVASIHVFNAADTVRIQLVDKEWRMIYPDEAKGNEEVLNYFFRSAFNATYSGMPMSESKTDLDRYGLQASEALQIKLLDAAGKTLVHCHFGNTNNPYDYFRYDKDNKIYQVKQVIYNHFQPNMESWRSPSILKLDWNQLSSITVEHSKNSYVLTQKDDAWHYLDARENFTVPPHNDTMGKLLNILANLEAYTFKIPSEIDAQKLKLEADVKVGMKDKSIHHLVFYKYGEEYLLVVDGDESHYHVMVFDQVFRFTRHAEVFKYKQYEG